MEISGPAGSKIPMIIREHKLSGAKFCNHRVLESFRNATDAISSAGTEGAAPRQTASEFAVYFRLRGTDFLFIRGRDQNELRQK